MVIITIIIIINSRNMAPAIVETIFSAPMIQRRSRERENLKLRQEPGNKSLKTDPNLMKRN